MRKAIKSYISGWKAVLESKRLWFWLYIINLIFTLAIALPFNAHLKKSVGHSLAFSDSVGEFDFSFIGDFLNNYGEGFNTIMNMSKWVVVLYLLFSVFLMGGILDHFKRKIQGFNTGDFTKAAGVYYWRLFGLGMFFLVLHLIFVFIFWMIFQTAMGGLSPFVMESTGQLKNTFLIVLAIYLLFAFLLLMIHDYAKIHIVYSEENAFLKPIRDAFKMVFTNFKSCFLLYLFNLLTFLALLLIYWQFQKWIPTDHLGTIILIFLIGQLFLFMRMGMRLLNLASATSLFKKLC